MGPANAANSRQDQPYWSSPANAFLYSPVKKSRMKGKVNNI